MARCKTCGQPIDWVTTETGSWLPIDPAPSENGNVHLRIDPSGTIARVCGSDAEVLAILAGDENAVFHIAHWATCTDVGPHRQVDGQMSLL